MHPVIGSGIAIAPYPAEWGDLRGTSVYLIAIAGVTLEIIRDRLECASSLLGRPGRESASRMRGKQRETDGL